VKASDELRCVLKAAESSPLGFTVCFHGKAADYLTMMAPPDGLPFHWRDHGHALTVLAFAIAMAEADGE